MGDTWGHMGTHWGHIGDTWGHMGTHGGHIGDTFSGLRVYGFRGLGSTYKYGYMPYNHGYRGAGHANPENPRTPGHGDTWGHMGTHGDTLGTHWGHIWDTFSGLRVYGFTGSGIDVYIYMYTCV